MTAELATQNDLLPVDLKSLPQNDLATDAIFGAVATASKFLPRLQLYTAANNECKSGKVPMNVYGLVRGKEVTVIGKTVEVIPLAWRSKALQIAGDSIVSKYDIRDPAFKTIMDQSDVKDSGCMFGPEFLVWIPCLKVFASFYMCSKSARMESPNLKAKLDEQKAATLDSTFIQGKKFSWQAPTIKGCSTPVEPPEAESLIAEVQKFNNPPKDETEVVEPSDANTRDR